MDGSTKQRKGLQVGPTGPEESLRWFLEYEYEYFGDLAYLLL